MQKLSELDIQNIKNVIATLIVQDPLSCGRRVKTGTITDKYWWNFEILDFTQAYPFNDAILKISMQCPVMTGDNTPWTVFHMEMFMPGCLYGFKYDVTLQKVVDESLSNALEALASYVARYKDYYDVRGVSNPFNILFENEWSHIPGQEKT